MKYLSCFSGIGGLEASDPPILLCESDTEMAEVLTTLYPGVEIWPDIRTLDPPNADVVAGGWPCQDISIAGLQAGLNGERSGLLAELIRVAQAASSQTIVAENVAHLLRMNSGEEFGRALHDLHQGGFTHIAWRVINTREFGLPQNRSRLLLIAASDLDIATTLFRQTPPLPGRAVDPSSAQEAAGFYWTAGVHSINYSHGYVPTIKVGSSVGIPSPPAVHYQEVVRTMLPSEVLQVQGFDIDPKLFSSLSSVYRAAGNAVARPIGRWVMDGLTEAGNGDPPVFRPTQDTLWREARAKHPRAGISILGTVTAVEVPPSQKATNLIDFLDTSSSQRLSSRASSGLLNRLERSGQSCPPALLGVLKDLAIAS